MGVHVGHDPVVLADEVARRSYGKLVAYLAARTRDVSAAEDALAEAFAASLADWPRSGCPDNPEAWLLAVARRKSIDMGRKQTRDRAAYERLAAMQESMEEAMTLDPFPDERLGLLFACAHPAIDAPIRAPLMLQAVLGLNAISIGSAFLVAPATMGKRLVRAKDKIRQAGIGFQIPSKEDLPERLDAVLNAIYAAYGEAWGDPAGVDRARNELRLEALSLSRLLAGLMPGEPEAEGLLALMLYTESRRGARRAPTGDFIPLEDQETRLWRKDLISEAEEVLRAASARKSIGRFQLEAAIQSAHVHRRLTGCSNWAEVVTLYDALQMLVGSPVVAINRAVAVAEVEGPSAGLKALEAVADDPRMREYQPYWAARADLLSRVGAVNEARHAYDMAIGLETDEAIRRFLQGKQAALK